MKKYYVLLPLILCSFFAFSQPKPLHILSPGDQLLKAQNNFIAGTIIPILGLGLSALIVGNSSMDSQKELGVYLSIGSGVVGVICFISGASHLGRAGRLLNQNKVGVTLDSNGIGVRWNLAHP